MFPNRARWCWRHWDDLYLFWFFLRNHFSMASFQQVWLHCLHSHLSSDNEIEINIHEEELDLHIKRMLVNHLYNSILCFSYSDIILVYTPAWFLFQFLIWFEKLEMVYTVSNLSYGFFIQCLMCWIFFTTIFREWYCIFIVQEVIWVLVKISMSTYTSLICN